MIDAVLGFRVVSRLLCEISEIFCELFGGLMVFLGFWVVFSLLFYLFEILRVRFGGLMLV